MFINHLVRFSFPKNVVICNKGLDSEFKINFKDFYFDSEDTADYFTINGLDFIDLSQVYYYTKSIWFRVDDKHDWVLVKREVINV